MLINIHDVTAVQIQPARSVRLDDGEIAYYQVIRILTVRGDEVEITAHMDKSAVQPEGG